MVSIVVTVCSEYEVIVCWWIGNNFLKQKNLSWITIIFQFLCSILHVGLYNIKYKSKYLMQPFLFEKNSQVEKAKYGFRKTVNYYDVLNGRPWLLSGNWWRRDYTFSFQNNCEPSLKSYWRKVLTNWKAKYGFRYTVKCYDVLNGRPWLLSGNWWRRDYTYSFQNNCEHSRNNY